MKYFLAAFLVLDLTPPPPFKSAVNVHTFWVLVKENLSSHTLMFRWLAGINLAVGIDVSIKSHNDFPRLKWLVWTTPLDFFNSYYL